MMNLLMGPLVASLAVFWYLATIFSFALSMALLYSRHLWLRKHGYDEDVLFQTTVGDVLAVLYVVNNVLTVTLWLLANVAFGWYLLSVL